MVYGSTAERAVVSEVRSPAQRALGSPGHTVLFGLRGSRLPLFSAALGEELVASKRLPWALRSYYLVTLKSVADVLPIVCEYIFLIFA